MFEGNPIYYQLPGTPPGLDGLRYMIGGAVAPFMGGMMRPYVPVSQSTFDAGIATYVNDPLYKQMMSGVLGQFGSQLGNAAGSMPFVRNVAGMAGYDPAQLQRQMTSGLSAFGRSFMGSAVMPLADSLLANLGVTGGSYVKAAQTMFNNRLMLASPGTAFNVRDPAQQHQSMADVAATMNLMNGLISGNGILPNQAVTQGFDRGQIASWVTQAAGLGAFSAGGLGIGARFRAATGGKDRYGLDFGIENLDFTKGDFTGGGVDSNLSGSAAEAVKKVTRDTANTIKDLTAVMGAVRDMLKTTDGLAEKLTALTGGTDWGRSGENMRRALADVRRLDAVFKAYNISPEQGVAQLQQNRGILQSAAGFGADMQAFGFNGGGMFGLAGQTELMATVEDAITARGIRGNPVLANRYRMQAAQAGARNMNTQAGVAAQILAYARQTGVVSDEDALKYQAGLTSGDRSVMGDSINRLLVTTFGSKERGRQLMQDSMFVNSMRQSMDDRASEFAWQTIIRGSGNEMARRERITMAENRFAFSRAALSAVGMSATQTDEGVGLTVDSIVGSLNGQEAGVGDMFRAEYERRIASGMKPLAAQRATVASFKRDPVYGKYAETIGLAVAKQGAANNESRYIEGGLESGQAKAMADAMRNAGVITGEQYGGFMKRIRANDGAGVLAELDGISAGLDSATGKRFSAIRADAAKRYDAAVATITDKRGATELIDAAQLMNYGSDAVVSAFDGAVGAMKDYMATKTYAEEAKGGFRGGTGVTESADYQAFLEQLDKSNVRNVFGSDVFNRLRDAVTAGSVVDPDTGKTVTADEYVTKLGRMGVTVRQVATQSLKDNGWGLNMSGFWGGGAFSGNRNDMLRERESLVAEYADAMQRDSVRNAGDRSTLAQDFVSMMESGDWRKLLKLHDAGGALEGAVGQDYFEQFARVEQLNASAANQHGALRDVVKAMRDADKYSQSETLVKMLGDAGKKVGDEYVWTDEHFIAQLEAGGIDPNSQQGQDFMSALASKRELIGAQDRLKALGKEVVGREGFAPAMRAWSENKAAAERNKKAVDKKVSAAEEYWNSLDLSNVSQFVKEGALRDAWTDMYDVVSEDMIKTAFGGVKSLDGYSETAVNQKAFGLLKAEAAKGNEKALGVMDKFQAAAKEANAMKIKGTLTLDVGGERHAAVLEGEMGGL